jgi:ribonuclease HI
MIQEDALNIFTDGSCLPSPRRGGVGIHFVTVNEVGDEVIENLSVPGYRGETNNRMELQACITSLEASLHRDLPSKIRRVIISSDSTYVIIHYKSAMFRWPHTKWMRTNGEPVLNADLWKKLVRLILKLQRLRLRVEFHWVKGHAKDPHNKAADKLAKQSAKNASNPPMAVVKVRRKKTQKSLEQGSVKMHGQRILIRVITDEYLKIQKINRYRYEVISPTSKYFGNVDIALSGLLLSAGHTYEVTFNKNQNNPRITRLIAEVRPTSKENL